MNTETTGQQAEVAADAAVDAVEDVIYSYEWAQDISSGMLKDANQGVAALRLLVAAVVDAYGEEPSKHCAEPGGPSCDIYDALAACRAVGGAR